MINIVTKRRVAFAAAICLLLQCGCSFGSDKIVSSAYGGTGSGGITANAAAGSAVDPAATAETAVATPGISFGQREDVSFSDMFYERPDIEAMEARLDDLKTGIVAGKPVPDLISAYQTLQELYAHADSMMSLAYLLYAFDVTESFYRDEYAYLQSSLSVLDGEMEGVSAALFESSDEAKQLANETFGSDYVEDILNAEDMTDTTVQDLSDQEEQLTLEYDNLCATFTILDNGKRWTMTDITNDYSLDYDEYTRLYDAYCAALNQEAGQIFLEQLKIREQIATRLGYKNYSDYCYDSYGRDYTPDEVRSLHAAVKKYIAPVYIYVNDRNDTSVLADTTFDEQSFLNKLQTAARDFSPILDEPVQYLMRNDLYDFSYSSNKMDNSFTTYLSDYRAPFIFSQWTGESTDISTVLHELGHFTNYYHNAAVGYSATDNLDLAEIDSQALVLLMTKYFDSFYGVYAQDAKTDVLLDAMYSLLSGCMEDEFQQEIYLHPDMSLSQINSLYKKLAVEYGLDDVYGFTGTEWVLISHTFQTPLYYISYAVSIVPSLELFELAQKDEEAAKEAYFSILMRDNYASFLEVLEENGLSSVFEDATIQRIAAIVDQST